MKTAEVRRWAVWGRVARGILVVVVAAPFIFTLWKVPQRQVSHLTRLTPEQRFDHENEARKTLAQILGGLFVLVGAGLTWRSLKLTEQAQRTNDENAQKTLRISAESQITDRYTKAIAQLGESSLTIRLGAIYALERIARDSERDHWPIMEVLTAYIREHSTLLGDRPERKSGPLVLMAPDIQAILNVLSRRNCVSEKSHQHLNLSFAYLHGANLGGANLSRADFRGADLSLSGLDHADLRETELIGADLKFASLYEANLSKSLLGSSKLMGANLNNADLSGANVVGAHLSGAMLSGANLSGVDLTMADGITEEQIMLAIVDETTGLPQRLKWLIGLRKRGES